MPTFPRRHRDFPTGEVRQVAGTDFDFRQAKTIGKDVRDARKKTSRTSRNADKTN